MVMMVFGVYSHPVTYITHYIIIISLFYFHSNIGLPWATKSKPGSYLNIPFLIIAEIAVYIGLCFGNDAMLTKWHILSGGDLKFSNPYAWRNLYRGLYFIGFSTGYYYLFTYLKEKRKSEELEKQKLKEIIQRQNIEQELTRSQNAFLKAQINPHFLFNTLDFIYHNISSITPVAADAIITLAEMMRFAIDADKMGELISMGDELEQVNNLIFLSRLRKDDVPDFRLIYGEAVTQILFIPLVLLTLTENIFKHGNLNEGQHASLSINISEDFLHIETDNQSTRTEKSGSHGTGLLNIEKRLKYAYGDGVEFNKKLDMHGRFKVSIKVPVDLLK